MYIRKFKFNNLYNFLENASSSEGYKHTEEARQKMVKRLEDKSNHPFPSRKLAGRERKTS